MRAYSLDQKKKIHSKRQFVSMQITPNFHNICKFIHENGIFNKNCIFLHIWMRAYSTDHKNKIHSKKQPVSEESRHNFHNLCKFKHTNEIYIDMVFLSKCWWEQIPWIKRRKFIQRDNLYLCKLRLISIIYANLMNLWILFFVIRGCTHNNTRSMISKTCQ